MGKLLDSIIEGRAKYNDIPQTLRRMIESSGFKKPWLYDAFGVPVITNLVERSVDSGNSDVYSLGDINDILKVRDGNKPDLLVPAENKPDVSIPPSEDPNWPYPGNYPRNDSNTDVPFKPSSKAEPTVNDLPKTNVTGRTQSIYRRIIDFMRKNKNPLIFAGAGAVGGAAIATAIALAISKNRKKKKALRKQAGFRDSITGYLARVSRYPALRNAISMYINGGAGDVSDAKGFGIQRSFWDYAAKAPTIEGTNMLRKVVGDIALSGGYGGKEPKRIRDKNGNLTDNFVDPYTGYSKDKQNRHYSELLRFFDSVGPHIFSPRTVLGNQMLTHPEGGILSNIEKGWLRALPYFEKDPDLVNKANMAFGGGVIGDTVNKLSDKADKAAK